MEKRTELTDRLVDAARRHRETEESGFVCSYLFTSEFGAFCGNQTRQAKNCGYLGRYCRCPYYNRGGGQSDLRGM